MHRVSRVTLATGRASPVDGGVRGLVGVPQALGGVRTVRRERGGRRNHWGEPREWTAALLLSGYTRRRIRQRRRPVASFRRLRPPRYPLRGSDPRLVLERSRYNRMKKGTVLLQSLCRGVQTRNNIEVQDVDKFAANEIQRIWHLLFTVFLELDSSLSAKTPCVMIIYYFQCIL